jgi:hypothetical protein
MKHPAALTVHALKLAAAASDEHRSLSEWLAKQENSTKIPHKLEACGYIFEPNPDNDDDGYWSVGSGAGRKQTRIYRGDNLTPDQRLQACGLLVASKRYFFVDALDERGLYGPGHAVARTLKGTTLPNPPSMTRAAAISSARSLYPRHDKPHAGRTEHVTDNTIRAIVIDPVKRTVTETRLPIAMDIRKIIGSMDAMTWRCGFDGHELITCRDAPVADALLHYWSWEPPDGRRR